MDATGQIFQISRFPNTSVVIIPGMFWWNLTKIGQIYVPYNFAQICRIPPKIKFEILAHRDSQTTTPHARRSSRLLKPQTMGQLHLLASMTMDQRFSIARWNVEEGDTIRSKVAKAKESPWQTWRSRKMCWGARQQIDRQLLKLRFEAIVDVFVIRLQ